MLQLKVLCVHADPGVQTTLALALSEFPLTCVSRGVEAIRARNDAPADAYLIGYWLPDWTGYALCRDIREADPHVPICVIGRDNDIHKRRALRAGADLFINEEDVLARLPVALRRLLDRVSVQSVGAAEASRVALADELHRRLASVCTETPLRSSTLDSMERTARSKALAAHIAGGGTLAGFERAWRREFDSALAAMAAHHPDLPQLRPDL